MSDFARSPCSRVRCTCRDGSSRCRDTDRARRPRREAFNRLVDSMAALHKESYIKTIEASGLQAQTLNIASIGVPTLIVCGEYDRLTPPEVSEGMHKKDPRFRARNHRGRRPPLQHREPDAVQRGGAGLPAETHGTGLSCCAFLGSFEQVTLVVA